VVLCLLPHLIISVVLPIPLLSGIYIVSVSLHLLWHHPSALLSVCTLALYLPPPGWLYFNGSFYYISSIAKSWQDSRDDCSQRGAVLAIISMKHLSKTNMCDIISMVMWIGLTDRETEGVWKWVDETPLTASFWYSGEPNNFKGRNEDCVVINHYYSNENNWNDAVCENEYSWLCEKHM
uniref:C-type lectin domain-containing protein n=1 Tax=Oreochromis niloticus TaxID=8128 RepID=A0A669B976_ORENI